jgi:hypothetical protein
MKKNLVFTFLVFSMIVLFSTSCGHSADPAIMETIVLNDGAKWVVDAPMMEQIKAMENAVKSFKPQDANDYEALADLLSEHIGTLTANCTMKGQGHDELHKWLVPFIGMVKNLSKKTDQKDLAAEFAQIKTSFTTLNEYFQ